MAPLSLLIGMLIALATAVTILIPFIWQFIYAVRSLSRLRTTGTRVMATVTCRETYA